jgi:hypothetical protein
MDLKEMLQKKFGMPEKISGALASLAEATFDAEHDAMEKLAEDTSLYGAITAGTRVIDLADRTLPLALSGVGVHMECIKRVGPQVSNEVTAAFTKAAVAFGHAVSDMTKMLLVDKTDEITKISIAVHRAMAEEARAKEEGKKENPEDDCPEGCTEHETCRPPVETSNLDEAGEPMGRVEGPPAKEPLKVPCDITGDTGPVGPAEGTE